MSCAKCKFFDERSYSKKFLFSDGPDRVILSPNETSLVLNEGSDVPSIECITDCQPGCSLTWIKPDGQEELTNVLILNNIKMNQTGTYKCNASNVVGNMISAGVTINLNGMYTFLILSMSHLLQS